MYFFLFDRGLGYYRRRWSEPFGLWFLEVPDVFDLFRKDAVDYIICKN